jgi:hypothetical protein
MEVFRMRAIIIKQFGGLDSLVIEKLADPVSKTESVLIKVKAFGINHAETHMRKGEWAEGCFPPDLAEDSRDLRICDVSNSLPGSSAKGGHLAGAESRSFAFNCQINPSHPKSNKQS